MGNRPCQPVTGSQAPITADRFVCHSANLLPWVQAAGGMGFYKLSVYRCRLRTVTEYTQAAISPFLLKKKSEI
jgi:hypothetical protein